MNIMAFDSSAGPVSVAIAQDGITLAEAFLNIKMTHSQTLMPMAQDLLNNVRIKLSEIDLFAVTNGPGSFTGVRIGVAAVKGLAMAEDKPVLGISTLEAIAAPLYDRDAVICAVMDARLNQAYNALFRCKNGKVERLTPDRAIGIGDLLQECKGMDQSVILAGDGADLCFEQMRGDGISLAAEPVRFQRAQGVALAAFGLLECGVASVGHEQLVPVYLRPSQAEQQKSV